ncbi:serine/threonine protein kinase [Micromonospora lupini]|uniref:serine/threonine-protein kinase n=1 Tax=Micromonospora lupini TaxID=285679 RepID=UPI002256BA6E|nr:serine/threonine-protein kinase [Micromonospora lupini]MCX5068981.1 serine/threonine protein kinase [Micromonospora lupini]
MKDDLLAGRYRRLLLIGSTTPARVWLARDELLDRHVALKQIAVPAWLARAERSRLQDRTLTEVRGLAGLDHPGVVAMWDVVSTDGHLWLVMEHVPGRSLAAAVAADGPLAVTEVIRVGRHVLAALGAAHSAGVVHRELRPDNVLLADDGRVLLDGFGLSIVDGRDPATVSGAALSTIQYVAPERARDRNVAPAADLWSLGATLYLAAEGRQPWARPSTLATLAALATEPPDPMRARPLEPTVTGLLRRNPRQRLTAVEARSRLEALASSTAAAGPAERSRSRRRRRAPTGPQPAVENVVSSPAVPGGQAPAVRMVVAPDRTRWAFAASVLGLLTVVAVVIIAAGTLIGGLGGRPDGDGPTAPGGAAAGAAEVAAPAHLCLDGAAGDGEPLPPVTAPPPGDLPDGWQWVSDPAGFRLAVPAGWTRHTDGGNVCFRDPVEPRAIAVDPAAEADPVPSTLWQAAEGDLRRSGAVPGYQKISIGPVIRPRGAAAEWEYTFDLVDGQRMHVRRLLVNDTATRAHSLTWLTPDSRWALDTPWQRLAFAGVGLDQGGT